jgi:hypothetical protein
MSQGAVYTENASFWDTVCGWFLGNFAYLVGLDLYVLAEKAA